MDDLLSVLRAQRATHDSEILRSNIHGPAINLAVTSYYAVSEIFSFLHPEIGALVDEIRIELDKTVGIKQLRKPFAGGQFSLCVLVFNPLGTSASLNERAIGLELFM